MQVWQAEVKVRKVLAVKFANDPDTQWSLMNEFRVSLRLGRQPNILNVEAVDSDWCGYANAIAMPLCEASLDDVMVKRWNQATAKGLDPTGLPPFTEEEVLPLARGILRGLLHCERKEVAHLDIKALNLLLADAGDLSSVKLADFGVARDYGEMVTYALGTNVYMAPELLAFNEDASAPAVRIGPEQDVFSVCVLFAELLSGLTADEVRSFAGPGALKGYLHCGGDLAAAICAGLQEDPWKRPHLGDLMAAMKDADRRLRHTASTAASTATDEHLGSATSSAGSVHSTDCSKAAHGMAAAAAPPGLTKKLSLSTIDDFFTTSAMARLAELLPHLERMEGAAVCPARPDTSPSSTAESVDHPQPSHSPSVEDFFTDSAMARLSRLLPPVECTEGGASPDASASSAGRYNPCLPPAHCTTQTKATALQAPEHVTKPTPCMLQWTSPRCQPQSPHGNAPKHPIYAYEGPSSPAAATRGAEELAASLQKPCWNSLVEHLADEAWQEQQAAAAVAAQQFCPPLPTLRISHGGGAAPVATPDTLATPLVDDAFNVGSAVTGFSPYADTVFEQHAPWRQSWLALSAPGGLSPVRGMPTLASPAAVLQAQSQCCSLCHEGFMGAMPGSSEEWWLSQD